MNVIIAALAGFGVLVFLIACHTRGRSDLAGLGAPLLGACVATVAVLAAVLLPPGPGWLAALVPVLLASAFAVARLPGSH